MELLYFPSMTFKHELKEHYLVVIVISLLFVVYLLWVNIILLFILNQSNVEIRLCLKYLLLINKVSIKIY